MGDLVSINLALSGRDAHEQFWGKWSGSFSGNEATVRDRVQELLANGLDELLLLAIPIADEATERKQLLHLIGSLY